MLSAYCAGPDVFFPQAEAHAARKVAICARHGILCREPLASAVDLSKPDASLQIYNKNLEMMRDSDVIIANLTAFRGPSADDGTAFEIGFFTAMGRPVYAYSNTAGGLAERTRRFLAATPDPAAFAVEDFGLCANLMLPHAVMGRGGLPVFTPADGCDRRYDDLETFARLVAAIAERHMARLHAPPS